MICKECGAYNPDHATYCKVCAANLKEDTSPKQEESSRATRTFVRPSWTVPSYAQKTQQSARPEEDAAEPEEETIKIKPAQKAPVQSEPACEEEPEAIAPEGDEEPFHDEPAVKPVTRKAPAFARKAEEEDNTEFEELDDEDAFDEFDEFDEEEEEEEVRPPRFAKKTPAKRAPVRIRDEEDEDDDEDDEDDEEEPGPRRPAKKAPVRIREEEDDEDDEDDDSYEYEPTPPRRDKKNKGNGPLFWILLVAILVVIVCIVAAGVLMLQSSNTLSCSGMLQGTEQTLAQVNQPANQQQTNPQQTGTQTAPAANQQQTENDPNVVKLEESVNDNGQPCVILNITATPHSVVTLQLPNQSDSVTPNDSDNTVIYRLTVTKDTFNPNVPLTESTYEVNPVIYRTESDGTTHQLTVPSFVLTFPTLTIDLEKPVENDEGIIMADKQNNVAISGHVDDYDVSVTVDGKPVIVYEGGLFMADYNMTATEPVTVVITADKPNYVSTSKEIEVHPYVYTPEKMILTVANDPTKELRVEKSTTISVRGQTLVGATVTATSDLPSRVVCGSVTVDGEGNYTFMVTMDSTFYGVSRITLTSEKGDRESGEFSSGEISFYVARAYESKDAFNSGYNKTKSYKEIGSKNPLKTIVDQKDTYASPSYGFRITAKVESVETRADGLSYVKLTLTSGESVIAINYGNKWDPASNIGKKYNLYGNFLGMSESDESVPLFAIFFAVAK